MTRVYVIDLEANGLYDTVTKLHCAVASSLDGKDIHRFDNTEMAEFVDFLATVDVWIGHNIIQYDIPTVKKVLGYQFKGKAVDTMLMSRLQNPHRTAPFHAKNKKEAFKVHGLYAWGVRVGIDKPEIEYWDDYTPEILHRCEEDVRINVATYHELRKEAGGQKWKDAHLLTFKLWENLFEQEQAGWKLDVPYINKSIHMLSSWIDRIDKVLASHIPLKMVVKEAKIKGEYKNVNKVFLKSGKYTESVVKHYGDDAYTVSGPFTRIAFRPVDLNSNDEVKEWLLEAGWIPMEWNTNAEGEQTSPKMSKTEEFEGVDGKVGRLIVKRVQSRHRRSQMEGWLRRIRADGRLASRVTGLADTRRAKHADIVNVPNAEALFGKQMRKGFTSRDGWSLVSADAASCQDRMMSERAGDADFTKMLLEGSKELGTDSHTLAMKAVNKVADVFKLSKISRGKAKNFNFAWTFGASDNKLGKMLGSNKEVGAAIRAALGEVFPAKAALIERVTREWESNAKVRTNRWGKKEYYNGWIEGLDGAPVFIKSGHAVLVYAVQSDEAIYMSAVYNLICKFMKKRFKQHEQYEIVCWYHDEVTVECKDEIKEEVAKVLEKAFAVATDYFKLSVPQIGEAAIGKNWLEVH